jgi:sugar phosphate isomerase/epimerase
VPLNSSCLLENKMRIGVCNSPEAIRPVDGLDYFEATVGDVLCPREGEAKFAQRLSAVKACPLPLEAVNVLFPGDMRLTGPAADFAGAEAYIRTVCRRAGALGIKIVVFGSGGPRRYPEGFDKAKAFDQVVEHLKRWAPLAQQAGLAIVMEPLNLKETNVVNTVDEGADVVRRVGHPNIRLLADTFHMARDGESPDSIRRAGSLLAHAHCAEAAARGPVGLGPENHRPYFRALREAGYDQRLSIEAIWQDFAAQLPAAVAKLREQLATA